MLIKKGTNTLRGAAASFAGGNSARVAGGSFEHATLRIVHPKGDEIIKLQFNPEEMTIGHTVNWAEDGDVHQYTGTKKDDLTLNLFFDAYEKRGDELLRDVREHGPKKIINLVNPTVVKEKIKIPPKVIFTWGEGLSYTGYVKKVDEKYTLFLPDGTPARMTLTVRLVPYLDKIEKDEVQPGTNSRKSWKVKVGDRLDVIAAAIYGKPELWKVIAEANRIEDPLSFPIEKGENSDIGRVIIVPHIGG